MFRFIYIYILLIFFFITTIAFSQQAGLKIIGKMIVVKGDFSDSKIEIRKNGELIKTIGGNEKIEMDLEKDKDYYFNFLKDGYISKSVVFITRNIPEDRWKKGFPPHDFKVELNKQGEDDVILTYNNPVGVFEYDKVMNDFFETKDYSATKLKLLKQLAGLDTSKVAEELH